MNRGFNGIPSDEELGWVFNTRQNYGFIAGKLGTPGAVMDFDHTRSIETRIDGKTFPLYPPREGGTLHVNYSVTPMRGLGEWLDVASAVAVYSPEGTGPEAFDHLALQMILGAARHGLTLWAVDESRYVFEPGPEFASGTGAHVSILGRAYSWAAWGKAIRSILRPAYHAHETRH